MKVAPTSCRVMVGFACVAEAFGTAVLLLAICSEHVHAVDDPTVATLLRFAAEAGGQMVVVALLVAEEFGTVVAACEEALLSGALLAILPRPAL